MSSDSPIKFGRLFLIPTPLGKQKENTSIPDYTIQHLHHITHFCVENLQNAVSFIKWTGHPVPEFELKFYELNKRTSEFQIQEYLQVLLNGSDVGILTDAGCPGVADPGAGMVKMAHHFDIQVVPLTGPSSPILALMASGLGGQRFAFHGYPPVKPKAREQDIRMLEDRSARTGSTELFMEAPHRNTETFKSLLQNLKNDTLVTIAANLTMPGAFIKTKEISAWKPLKAPEIDKIPLIFGLKAKSDTPAANLNRKAVKKKFGR